MNYAEFVQSITKPGDEIQKEISAEQLDMLHMAVGICTEAGELLSAIKSHVIYQKELDIENCIEEGGDILFYLQGMMNNLNKHHDRNLSFDVLKETNQVKLEKRYHQGSYSDSQAQDRADKALQAWDDVR